MTQQSSKQAEKAYLRLSGSRAWEEVKPFSPAATQTFDESVRLIHDFAVAALALDVMPGHRVLDLGVGAGWTTEWLRRLNVDAVAVDIAYDMLEIARVRVASPGVCVAGDLEALPFASNAFDRALCMNALHHLPDPGAALREAARVLNDHGRLVLVEPGAGHAERETSVTAVREFGVLEQDLHATDLLRLCHDAGFQSVTVRPLSYMSDEITLTADQLERWQRWTHTSRPRRVVRKLRLLVDELFGAAKQTSLYEEYLGLWVARVLGRHVNEQAVVVASKSADTSTVPYRARLELLEARREGSTLALRIKCVNVGAATWSASGRHPVQIGMQLLGDEGAVLDRDYARAPLPHDVAPLHECIVHCSIPRPQTGAALRIDPVAEGMTWFELNLRKGLIVPLSGQ